MRRVSLVLACLASFGYGEQDSVERIDNSLADSPNAKEALATLFASLNPDASFNPSAPMPSSVTASRSGLSGVSMATKPQLKGAKWAAAKRPKKTRPSDINRKPRSWEATQKPIPDIPWITPLGKKVPLVKETELPKMGLQMPKQKMWMPHAADLDKSKKTWYLVDAEGLRLGRMASEVAMILLGKRKPTYTPGKFTGDYVIIVNAEKIVVTGKKFDDKLYRRHSGRPGGMKIQTFRQLQARFPERIVEKAIVGMLPKNKYGRELFRCLKVYAGPEHPHDANNPVPITFGGLTSAPYLRGEIR